MSNQNYRFEETSLKKMNIRLLYITEARYENDWNSIEHTHHFTELFYVTSGKGDFLIENETFPVKENDLVIVNPNVSHTEIGHQEEPLEYIVLGINGLQFQNSEKEEPLNYGIHNFSQYKQEFYFYLTMLIKEIRKKEDNFDSICNNLLEILIWNIIRKSKKKFPSHLRKKSQKNAVLSSSI